MMHSVYQGTLVLLLAIAPCIALPCTSARNGTVGPVGPAETALKACDQDWYDPYFEALEKLFGIAKSSDDASSCRHLHSQASYDPAFDQQQLLNTHGLTADDDVAIQDETSVPLEDTLATSISSSKPLGSNDSVRDSHPLASSVSKDAVAHFGSLDGSLPDSWLYDTEACPSCSEPLPLHNHPFIMVANVTALTCQEYVTIEFQLAESLFRETFSAKVSYYDVLLLDDSTLSEKLQLLPAFPLLYGPRFKDVTKRTQRVSFFPWNADRLQFDVLYRVQVRVLGPSGRPLVDSDRNLFLSSVSEPFLIPSCPTSDSSYP